MLGAEVPLLRPDGDIVLSDDEAALLVSMSLASADRYPAAPARLARGPGALAHQAWHPAQVPDPHPDLGRVDRGHPRLRGDRPGRLRGGNSSGEFCFTLTVTDIATGWIINHSV